MPTLRLTLLCGVISERIRRSAAPYRRELGQRLRLARLRWGRQQKCSTFKPTSSTYIYRLTAAERGERSEAAERTRPAASLRAVGVI